MYTLLSLENLEEFNQSSASMRSDTVFECVDDESDVTDGNDDIAEEDRVYIDYQDPDGLINTYTWDIIPDYTSYEGTIMGFVRNRHNGEIMTGFFPKDTTHPYIKVGLTCDTDKKKHTLSVHRIICKLYNENDDPEHKTRVDHIDGKTFNNASNNLRWVTVSENNRNRIYNKT